MLSYAVTYFVNQNVSPTTVGLKSLNKLTATKFKQFMKVQGSKNEKQLIQVEKIEAISEEELTRRFGNTWILIDR